MQHAVYPYPLKDKISMACCTKTSSPLVTGYKLGSSSSSGKQVFLKNRLALIKGIRMHAFGLNAMALPSPYSLAYTNLWACPVLNMSYVAKKSSFLLRAAQHFQQKAKWDRTAKINTGLKLNCGWVDGDGCRCNAMTVGSSIKFQWIKIVERSLYDKMG